MAVVARLKEGLSADGGDAEAVSVVGDAGDHSGDDALVAGAVFGIVERAEAERVHHGDGAGAHGKNVAQNAADPGGGALEGLDKAGVIVGLDLEGDDIAAANIDDAGILARSLDDERAASGELFQVDARTLVRAVLAPHHGENAQFGVGGLAAEDADDGPIFGGRELVLGDEVRGDDCRTHAGTTAASMDSKTL